MDIILGRDHVSVITQDEIDSELHQHSMLQLAVSLEEMSLVVDGEVNKTRGIVIDSNVEHFLKCKRAVVFIFVNVESSFAKELKKKYLTDKKYYNLNEVTINLMEKMYRDRDQIISSSQVYLNQFKEIQDSLNVSSNTVLNLDDRIHKLIDNLKNCTDDEHFMKKYADELHLSESRLSHLFKENIGVSLSSYLRFHKLEKALVFIFSGMSITEAAMKAGFDSPSHFSSVCKKSIGMSASSLKEDSQILRLFN